MAEDGMQFRMRSGQFIARPNSQRQRCSKVWSHEARVILHKDLKTTLHEFFMCDGIEGKDLLEGNLDKQVGYQIEVSGQLIFFCIWTSYIHGAHLQF